MKKAPLKDHPETGSPFAATNSVRVDPSPKPVPVKDHPEQGSPFTGYHHPKGK